MTPRPALRPTLERLAYALYLAALVLSLGSAWLGGLHGISSGDFTALAMAGGSLALTCWLHVDGFAHWHFQRCADSLEVRGAGRFRPGSEETAARGAELDDLFARLESEPEVWMRGELRRQITTRLGACPELRADFAEALARHPEL